jgi:hypothetical protein
VSREQALKIFAAAAEYAAFEENDKGSIEPGELAVGDRLTECESMPCEKQGAGAIALARPALTSAVDIGVLFRGCIAPRISHAMRLNELPGMLNPLRPAVSSKPYEAPVVWHHVIRAAVGRGIANFVHERGLPVIV